MWSWVLKCNAELSNVYTFYIAIEPKAKIKRQQNHLQHSGHTPKCPASLLSKTSTHSSQVLRCTHGKVLGTAVTLTSASYTIATTAFCSSDQLLLPDI